jgi:hypothetical protein
MTTKPRIAVVIGSTRPGRYADKAAGWMGGRMSRWSRSGWARTRRRPLSNAPEMTADAVPITAIVSPATMHAMPSCAIRSGRIA